jgi:hypothetical protein
LLLVAAVCWLLVLNDDDEFGMITYFVWEFKKLIFVMDFFNNAMKNILTKNQPLKHP